MTFDLTGLPPTLAEIDAFLADQLRDARSRRLVDRLLASPAFGERWGRHWLDVARYGESTGSARNLPYPHAWRYRDYVIDAFNSDKPYDQFIREQIAGDLLPAQTRRRSATEQLIATGFLALGVKDVNQRFKVRFVMDNIDEQIDTVSAGGAGADGELRPLPRSQVRPDPDRRLLRPGRHLPAARDLCAGAAQQDGRRRPRLLRHRRCCCRWDRGTACGARRSSGQIRSLRRELGQARDELRRREGGQDAGRSGAGPPASEPAASRDRPR